MKHPTPRCSEQHFLNLPGHHAGAYVRAYIEATEPEVADDARWQTYPRTTLEIADCIRRINLEFDLSSAEERANSFHKIDTLIAALTSFREGMVIEARHVRARDAIMAEREASKSAATTGSRPFDANAYR